MESRDMRDEVSVREVNRQPVASIRVDTTPREIGDTLAQLLSEVEYYLREAGVDTAGPPFSRSHVFEPDRVDLEAGFPVSQPMAGDGRVIASYLPGGTVVATWHTGPYTTIANAYDRLEAWMREGGREPAGAPWEVYWVDPGEEADSAKWRTEVVWPVTK